MSEKGVNRIFSAVTICFHISVRKSSIACVKILGHTVDFFETNWLESISLTNKIVNRATVVHAIEYYQQLLL